MRTIEVSDEVYERLQKAARESEKSVEEYVGRIVEEDLEWLFTPEFIAEQHRIADEMAHGADGLTMDEVREGLEAYKARHRNASQ